MDGAKYQQKIGNNEYANWLTEQSKKFTKATVGIAAQQMVDERRIKGTS